MNDTPLGRGVLELGPAWLFCPAHRPDRFGKAAAAADAVILDLEDGVGAADRPHARAALLSTPLDPRRTVVRVNAVDTADHALDVDAVRRAGYRQVMVAKAESAQQLTDLGDLDVIALCETPAGVLRAESIAAAAPVVAVMWGAEDLAAAVGIESSRLAGGEFAAVLRHARTTVLFAAAAVGKPVIDTVHVDLADLAGLASEASEASAGGFRFKACIHPSQVPVVRASYRPAPEQLDRARRLLAAAGTGVFVFEGRMVDEPVLRQARAIVARAG